MERSVVKAVKASSSGVWGRAWHTVAAVNRTASSTNTTAIDASSVGWGNALRWGWRPSVSLHWNPPILKHAARKHNVTHLVWGGFSPVLMIDTSVQFYLVMFITAHLPRLINGVCFSLSCPEWEKTYRCHAQRETCQLCGLYPEDLYSEGPKQSTHRYTNLYVWCRNRRFQVSGNQNWQSSGLGSLWHCLNCGLMMLCIMGRSSLLDQGLLVNIQQPVIQSDGTLLLATDSKVQLQLFLIL